MKNLLFVLLVLFGSAANAKSFEVGAGDYYTYKYTGDEYTALLSCSNIEWKNMFLVGRGFQLDKFLYIGGLAGISLKDVENKSGLGLTAGIEVSASVEIKDGFTVKVESIQTPFMNVDTVIFGYRF